MLANLLFWCFNSIKQFSYSINLMQKFNSTLSRKFIHEKAINKREIR